MIFAFLSRYETCLSISVNISCNFQICKYDEITTSLLSSFYFIYNVEHSILIFLTKKIIEFFIFYFFYTSILRGCLKKNYSNIRGN